MAETPLVSVIIPTYKRPEMLARAIDSVLAQDYAHIEAIVVNDNPLESDEDRRTEEVLSAYAAELRVVALHTAGKTGGGAARNFAEKHCHGSYLTFLDDDDVYLPHKVSQQLSYMLEHDLDFCYTDVCWYTPDEKLVEHRRLDYVQNFTKEELLRQHILHSLSPSAIYMVKKSLYDMTEGFGEVPVGQDWFLMLRCIEAGARMGYLPECEIKQYLHEGERLSTGKNKIEGENRLFRYKRKYYSILSPKERRYVTFRHYAVLSFASMRSRRPLEGIAYGIRTIISSPADCISEAKRYLDSKRH